MRTIVGLMLMLIASVCSAKAPPCAPGLKKKCPDGFVCKKDAPDHAEGWDCVKPKPGKVLFCGMSWPISTTMVECNDESVSDLTPLANMTNLKGLYLYGTNVSDITPLANLTNLKGLYLYGTKVSKEHADAFRKLMPKCKVGGP